MPMKTPNFNRYLSLMIDKSYLSEYISNNSSKNEEFCLKEGMTNISPEDESIVIKYLLEIMRAHDIVTEEEYQIVLYKYS